MSRDSVKSNTVERAIKTETDTRTEEKGVGKLSWFMSKTYTVTSPAREGEPVGAVFRVEKTGRFSQLNTTNGLTMG